MARTGAKRQRTYIEKKNNDEDYKHRRAVIDKRYLQKRKLTETKQERNVQKAKASKTDK